MAKKVLLVDDDADIRTIGKNVVTENGYSPLEAEDGLEGLEIVKAEKPDLIVLDVMMPKQSGLRLYHNVKTDKKLKNIPIIMLSGISKNAFLRSQNVLTEFGDKEVPEPDEYLEKPVDPEKLADTINKYLK